MIPHRRPYALLLALALLPGGAAAYPLDLANDTGIDRLEAYRLGHQVKQRHGQRLLPEGALLPGSDVRLNLRNRPALAPPPADPALSARLRAMLGADAEHFSVSLLDISDPGRPRLAAIQPEAERSPASVGKLLVLLAWFQALADLYPDDVAARIRVLREADITADAFARRDSHVVPFWKPGDRRVVKRPIEEGDTANVWTWLDWMCSSSSNAAASVLMAQLLLLDEFGQAYPVSPARAEAFFDRMPAAELSRRFLRLMEQPVRRNGLDPGRLRQGSFFTREGRRRVPGTSSVATSAELLRFMLRLEQGLLVDEFSSLEIKRLLYLTEERIRYAAQPVLDTAALYFKSGSLYRCKPEPGFACRQYRGNVLNALNSVVTVETRGRQPALRYIVVVLSNVLRKDAAALHERLALQIHRMLEELHPEREFETLEAASAAREAPRGARTAAWRPGRHVGSAEISP